MQLSLRTFHRSLPVLILLTFIASVPGCESSTAPGSDENNSDPDLAVVLTVKEASTPQQRQYFVTIVNNDDRSHDIVLPGDGSASHWRTPCIGWSVIDVTNAAAVHPDTTPCRVYPRCGNINPLRMGEIVTLHPGDSCNLGGWASYTPFSTMDTTGTFSVCFHYENIPDFQWKGVPLGEHDPDAMQRVRQSTRFRGRSNPVIVTYP